MAGDESECPQCGASLPAAGEEKAPALSEESSPLFSIFPASNPEPPLNDEKKSSRRWKKLLVALVVLLLLGGAWGFYSWYSFKSAEERAWLAARDSATLSALSAFMCDYPDGAHFEQADSLFQALKLADEMAWRKVENAREVAPYEEYLSQYPQGMYAGKAAQKVDSLDWEQTALENTEEAYTRYLEKHPSGAYVAEAQMKYQALERMKLTAEEETEVELTMEAYCRAVQGNDENALLTFFEPEIELYYTKKNATEADVLQSQRELYSSSVLNMAFVISGDFVSSKDADSCYHTAFPVDLAYTHADSGEQTHKRLLIKAVLNPDLKIKMITSEELPLSDSDVSEKGSKD